MAEKEKDQVNHDLPRSVRVSYPEGQDLQMQQGLYRRGRCSQDCARIGNRKSIGPRRHRKQVEAQVPCATGAFNKFLAERTAQAQRLLKATDKPSLDAANHYNNQLAALMTEKMRPADIHLSRLIDGECLTGSSLLISSINLPVAYFRQVQMQKQQSFKKFQLKLRP